MRKGLLTSLDWEVRREPVKFESSSDSTKIALIRSDSHSLLGIHSSDYAVFYNEEFMKLSKIIEGTGMYSHEGYYEFRDGKKILSYFSSNTRTMLNGHEAKGYLVVGNSHDGTRQIYVGIANRLIRCENQFYQTTAVLKRKHIRKFSADRELADDIISNFETGNNFLNKKMERFNQVQIDDDVVKRLVKEICERMNYDSRSANLSDLSTGQKPGLLFSAIERETEDLGMNLFGLFNGVTRYTTHHVTGSPELFSGTFGVKAKINDIAMNFCNNIMKQI